MQVRLTDNSLRQSGNLAARPILRDRIIISNVARNHCYPIVEAAEAAGYLKKFVTSVYYKPRSLSGRVMHNLAARLGDRSRKRLELRRSPLVPDQKVVDIPLPEILEEGLGELGMRFGVWNDNRARTYLKCEAFDWLVATRHMEPCTIFHGFEQCALYSLRRARALGAITVLDQPIIHRATLDRIEAEERTRHGVPFPGRRPFGFDRHVLRKYKELELSDYVFGGLAYVKETMVENGFPEDHVFVIPYGADTGSYRPISRPPRRGLEILYAGPLNFWKGLPYLLDVMEGLDIPGARLTIIGRSDAEWRPYMDRRIAALGDRARYIGTVPQTDMPRIYADADVLAFPSLVGGLGLVCFEAMATALPVVTSDGDVILRDGVDGMVVPARDIEGWRRAFRRLSADRDYRQSIGTAGADRLQSFTWDAYRSGIRRAYEEISEREASNSGAPRRPG
jgi:glycosyltransferase involved in cell wall biosynthesis